MFLYFNTKCEKIAILHIISNNSLVKIWHQFYRVNAHKISESILGRFAYINYSSIIGGMKFSIAFLNFGLYTTK